MAHVRQSGLDFGFLVKVLTTFHVVSTSLARYIHEDGPQHVNAPSKQGVRRGKKLRSRLQSTNHALDGNRKRQATVHSLATNNQSCTRWQPTNHALVGNQYTKHSFATN